ncbi:EspG family protein [Haloechinothrix alba]|uniref:EspG family protein n=1 Tax=Haloechinothrix alba TaxID=664784 RepID=A0A238Y927_9PSEU|nr:ESX secretion-associated protein EspG [Haloechinothrix alba]SNR67755.1 EspG family protein [Haloechinothrix alba]
MSAASSAGSVVLSALEFDVLWEAEQLGSRHPALAVPSPGTTHTERAELVEATWPALERRGLARGRRAGGELLDMLAVLARPTVTFDVWVWADRRISGLAAGTGDHAMLGVVDAGEVWLIPTTDPALASAAISVAGDVPQGGGQSVTLPYETLVDADAQAEGDPHALVTALEDAGVRLWEAQEVAGMFLGTTCRGQVGAQRRDKQGLTRRAPRVVAFHDTDAGRYLFQVEHMSDGLSWATLAPADNHLLAARTWELLAEV